MLAFARLPNGKDCLFNHCEIVLPASSLEGLDAQQIGQFVVALIPRVEQFARDFGSTDRDNFESIEEFDAAVLEKKALDARKVARAVHVKRLRQEITSNYEHLFMMIGRRDGFRCKRCGSSDPDLQIDQYCAGLERRRKRLRESSITV